MKSSRIQGFYKMSVEERVRIVKEFAGLDDEDVELLKKHGRLDLGTADRMIENVVGTFELPFAVATNFLIDGKDYLIPMVIEEPSVVAAASNAAKLARAGGGFKTEVSEPLMISQVQVVGVKNVEEAKKNVEEAKGELLKIANEKDEMLLKLGGGARDVEVREIETKRGSMLIVHLTVNVKDAMGANVVNTMAEAIAGRIEELTGGKVRLRIVTNLATKRIAKARATWLKDVVGEDVVEGVLDAYEFAANDIYRAATHNKGIMNGIDALAIATGNDFRAVEAGAHSFASFAGRYKPLTRYEKDGKGNLIGYIELPLAMATVGGATKTNPLARVALKILGVSSSRELAGIAASLGLAQNFAALRALATEGIQRGHMKLHARNIAVMAGAEGIYVDLVAKRMVEEGKINVARAQEILKELMKRKEK